MKKYYITTPLYYVNAKPHIGHAYTNILCDTFARYQRLLGREVFFLTGTDEHGTKIEKTARDQKKPPQEYVEGMVPQFKELWKLLNIRYDYFIRTTDEDHKRIVQNILRDLEKRGEIYRAAYTGWYCTPCESFWTGLQLKEGRCPDCGREVQQLSEENYFFRLAKYQDWLIDYIQRHPGFIRPEIRRNEILGFLRRPLEDLSITRLRSRLSWGIDFPGSPEHVVYVWFDALINYISAAGFTLDEKRFNGLWPADVHMVGKDILRQHAVYWPVMLRACGVEMPRTVFAHGWWTLGGTKVSKSRGNAVDPVELSRKYSVDALRYFLLREVTPGFDGAFSEDLLAERYTSDLANDLGNLWFRFASMLEKYFESKIPEGGAYGHTPLLAPTYDLWEKIRRAMEDYDPRTALDEIFKVITSANQFVEETKPWVLAKDRTKKEELASVLVTLGESLAHVAVLLLAFLPETAAPMLSRLKLPADWALESAGKFTRPFLKSGINVDRGKPLFPRLEEEKTPQTP